MFEANTYHMNRKLISLALVALSVAACKKSSQSPSTGSDDALKANIVGKWHYTADTVMVYKNGTVIDNQPTGGVTSAYYEQFNSDGTGQSGETGDDSVVKFTYSINKNVITVNTAAYSSNGFNYPATVERATIRTATSNTLVLYYDDTETDGGDTYRTTEVAHLAK